MSVPVIIAARNEAQNIGLCLAALSKQNYEVEPIVVINGCNDETKYIAELTGAKIIESDEGKMIAIQAGLRHLGKRALDPLLILDADSKPLSRNWSLCMTSNAINLPRERPAVLWGPYYFHGEINPIAGIVYTANSIRASWVDRNNALPRTVRGGNTSLKIKEKDLLDELLSLENYWPREDVAIVESSMKHNASKKLLFHPDSWVQTSGFRPVGILERLINGRQQTTKTIEASYAHDAPLGSKPYDPHL